MANLNCMDSEFTGNPISAYFLTDKKELVIIDCPISTFEKLKQLKLRSYKQVYILITHSDLGYFREISLLVKKLKRKVIIVTPNEMTSELIAKILKRDKIKNSKFMLVEPLYLLSAKLPWFKKAIKLTSTQTLMCNAYHLSINNIDVFYAVGVKELNSMSGFITNNSLLILDSEMFLKVDKCKYLKSCHEVSELAESLEERDIFVNVMKLINVMTLIQPKEYVNYM